MYAYFPGYGWLGPSFDGRRSLIPGVMPVIPPPMPAPASAAPGSDPIAGGGTGPLVAAGPGLPSRAQPGVGPSGLAGWAPGPTGLGLAQSGSQTVRAPMLGGPLAALAGTPLGPALAQLLASRPDLGTHPPGSLPPEIPGMPAMPPPPPGMFEGMPAGGIGQPSPPPSWVQPAGMAGGW